MNQNNTIKDWLVILNPAAGSGKAKKYWPKINTLLSQYHFDFEMVETKHKGHGIQLAKQGISKGYQKIIAIGGDGTNNEVINGIFTQKEVSPSQIIYTLIPIGTGNDWIKTHGIPKDFNQWIPLIKKLKVQQQDIGLVTYYNNGERQERYFANVAGMAYDGHISKVSSTKSKAFINKLFYFYLIINQLFKYKNKRAALLFNGKEFVAHFYSINVGICKYSGGGMQLVPHAIPNDGLLALTYDTGLSKFEVIRMLPRLFNGTIHKHSKIKTHQVKMLRVEARENKPTYLEVDGEFLGETPCEFYIFHKVLHVIVP